MLRVPLGVFFQPVELDRALNHEPRFRRRVLWLHVAATVALVGGAAAAVHVFRTALGWEAAGWQQLLLAAGAFYLAALTACLIASGVAKRHTVFGFIAAPYWAVPVLVLWAVTLWLLRPPSSSASGTALAQVWLIAAPALVCSVLATTTGRTRGVKPACAIALILAVFGGLAIFSDSRYTSDVDYVESTESGRAYLVVNVSEPVIERDGLLMAVRFKETRRLLRLSGRNIEAVAMPVTSLARRRIVTQDTLDRLTSGPERLSEDVVRRLAALKDRIFDETEYSYLGSDEFQTALDRVGIPREVYDNIAARSSVSRGLLIENQWYGVGRNELNDPRYYGGPSAVDFGKMTLQTARRDDGRLAVTLTGNGTTRWAAEGEAANSVLIGTDRDLLIVQHGSGLLAFDTKTGTQKWQIGESSRFNVGRSIALLRPGSIYNVSGAGTFQAIDAATGKVTSTLPLFGTRLSTLPRRVLGALIPSYFAFIAAALLIGLYRLPSYTLGSAVHIGALALLFVRRIPVNRIWRLTPVVFDHVSILRPPFARWFVRKVAARDPGFCANELSRLFLTTQRHGFAAQCYEDFHARHKDWLLASTYMLLRQDDSAPLLKLLVGRLSARSAVGPLVRSYAQLVQGPATPDMLAGHAALLERFADQEYLHARALAHIYGVLHALSGLVTLQDLAAADKCVAPVLSHSDDEWSLVKGGDVFSIVSEMANDLRNYDVADNYRDKQYFLAEARIRLYDISRRAEEMAAPEGPIVGALSTQWQGIIVQESKALRGPAEIQLAVLTRSLTGTQPRQSVVVKVTNTGQSPAENIRVRLLENESVAVLDDVKVLQLLGTGDSAELEFAIGHSRNAAEIRLYFDTTFDDFQRKGKLRPAADVISVVSEETPFRRVTNPYIVGTPLQSNKMFFGRQRALQFAIDNLRAGDQNNALIFFGQRRVGKSSILYRLMESPLTEECVFTYIDCQGFAADTARLLYRLCLEVSSALVRQGCPVQKPDLKRFKEDGFVALDEYLDIVESAAGSRRICLMFDEYEFLEYRVKEGGVSPQIFDKLRNLMQHRNRRFPFIFVGTHQLTELTADYWSFLFNTALYHEIGSLSEAESRALIVEPVKGELRYDDLAVEKILRVTGSHPYFIQVTCRLVVNFCNDQQRNYVTLADVNEVLREAVEGSTAHVKYLYKDYATPQEQQILAALARVTDESKRFASSTEVWRLAVEDGLPHDFRVVVDLLSALKNKRLLREEGHGGGLYGFEYEFLRIWIERHVRVIAGTVSIT